MSKIDIWENIVIIVYNYTKTFHLYCAQEMIFHESLSSWLPMTTQLKSSPPGKELLWSWGYPFTNIIRIYMNPHWITLSVFLRRSAWIVWGVTCLATERRNCVLESKPVGSTNSSWCSIKAYSTLNPINPTSTTNGSVPADLHKASQSCTSPPGSRDLPECWLVLEAEFLDHEVVSQAEAEMVMPLCKHLRVCVSFSVIVIAIVSKAASVGCFERILLHSGLAVWH